VSLVRECMSIYVKCLRASLSPSFSILESKRNRVKVYVSVFGVRLELWSPVCYLDLDDLESTDSIRTAIVKMVMELNWSRAEKVKDSSYIFQDSGVYVCILSGGESEVVYVCVYKNSQCMDNLNTIEVFLRWSYKL